MVDGGVPGRAIEQAEFDLAVGGFEETTSSADWPKTEMEAQNKTSAAGKNVRAFISASHSTGPRPFGVS